MNALLVGMTNTNKSLIKALETRVAVLRAELADPYTVRLGAAAVKCVQETLDATLVELARVRG